MKKTLYILLLICAGVVVGSLASSLTAGISWLSWLSYGQSFGLTSPLVLDLGIINLTFGIMVDVNIASLIFIALALIIGKAVSKGK